MEKPVEYPREVVFEVNGHKFIFKTPMAALSYTPLWYSDGKAELIVELTDGSRVMVRPESPIQD